MRKIRFRAELLAGHKGTAVPVPFDPGEKLGTQAVPLWRGRRGHMVSATLNGIAFEGVIVARAGRFFLLVDDALARAAGIAVGGAAQVAIGPRPPA